MEMLQYNQLQHEHSLLLKEQKQLQKQLQEQLQETIQIYNDLLKTNTNNIIAKEEEIQVEINTLVNSDLLFKT